MKRSFRGAKSAQTLCIIRSKRTQNMHTSFAVDPQQKMSNLFGTGRSANLTRDLFMSEHLRVNLSSRNMLYQLNYLKSHRVCRHDREPSRMQIRSLKRSRRKSRKVRRFVYARILSCIPMSSTLYFYVSAKKLLHKRKV